MGLQIFRVFEWGGGGVGGGGVGVKREMFSENHSALRNSVEPGFNINSQRKVIFTEVVLGLIFQVLSLFVHLLMLKGFHSQFPHNLYIKIT